MYRKLLSTNKNDASYVATRVLCITDNVLKLPSSTISSLWLVTLLIINYYITNISKIHSLNEEIDFRVYKMPSMPILLAWSRLQFYNQSRTLFFFCSTNSCKQYYCFYTRLTSMIKDRLQIHLFHRLETSLESWCGSTRLLIKTLRVTFILNRSLLVHILVQYKPSSSSHQNDSSQQSQHFSLRPYRQRLKKNRPPW